MVLTFWPDERDNKQKYIRTWYFFQGEKIEQVRRVVGLNFKQSGWISLTEKVWDETNRSRWRGKWRCRYREGQRRQHRDIKEVSSIVPKMVKVLHFVDVLSKYWKKEQRKHCSAQHRVWQRESKGMAFPFHSHGECVLCRVRKNWTRYYAESVFGPQPLLIP